MKKVLVTGADGFIGSHLTESLLEKGYDVKVFTYYNSFNTWGWLDTLPKEKLNQIEVFSGDIRDPNGVREAMKGVDQVFLERFVEEQLGDREKIYASELPMETMDDFIRLIYVRLYGSRKKMRYRIEKAEGANKISGEFDFPDFAIIKR